METLKLSNNSKVRFFKDHCNTFSLAQGREEDGGTCVNATEACLKVCYDKNLRKLYKNYAAVEDFNTSLVRDKLPEEQYQVVKNTVLKWLLNGGGKKPYFRIHTGGEFFNAGYVCAWARVIAEYPEIHFWAYTRSLFAIPILIDLKNLTLFLSCDTDNKEKVLAIYEQYKDHSNLAIAYMGDEFPSDAINDRDMLVCPEVTGKIKNTSEGACSRCRACIDRKLKTGKIRHIQFPIHR